MALSERCNTSLGYVGEIEMGRKFPSIDIIEKMAHALRVEPFELFVGNSGEYETRKREPKDFLYDLPVKTRKDMASTLLNRIRADIEQTLKL
jgi:transcriptional regulator with XRE-family HTH domain